MLGVSYTTSRHMESLFLRRSSEYLTPSRRGSPSVCSTYQVVVEEESLRKVKRDLGLQDCFPLPMSHGEAQARGTPHYYTAELPPSSLPEASPFTVGDNHTYNGYWNPPLDPRKSYLVYFQAMSNFRGVSTSSGDK